MSACEPSNRLSPTEITRVLKTCVTRPLRGKFVRRVIVDGDLRNRFVCDEHNPKSCVERAEATLGTNGILRAAVLLAAVAGLAGCASNADPYGDPGARPMPPGYSCQSVRAELNRLDAKGIRPKVEAASSGRKLSAQAQAEVDRYNYLLNVYLGARCHV